MASLPSHSPPVTRHLSPATYHRHGHDCRDHDRHACYHDCRLECHHDCSQEEQLSFVDVALGLKDSSLRRLETPLPHADIVILDENIDLNDSEHLHGSDLAGELRQCGFRGVVCVITASSLQVGHYTDGARTAGVPARTHRSGFVLPSWTALPSMLTTVSHTPTPLPTLACCLPAAPAAPPSINQ